MRKEEDSEKNEEGKRMLETPGEEPARQISCCDLERMT